MIRLWTLSAVLVCSSLWCFGAEFEVVSVKVVENPVRGAAPMFTGGPNSDDPGRLRAYTGMFALLMKAFGVSADQIVCPDWVRSGQTLYDIEATLPSATSQSEFESMLQTMLRERFNMRFHRSQKTLPGYELRLVNRVQFEKNASLKPSSVEPPPGIRTMEVSSHNQRYDGHNVSLEEFADYLGLALWHISLKEGGGFFDPRPRVVDKTGLTGMYSFALEYAASSSVSPGDAASSSGAPNLKAALRIHLGLDLVKAKDVGVDIITVEALESVPTAN